MYQCYQAALMDGIPVFWNLKHVRQIGIRSWPGMGYDLGGHRANYAIVDPVDVTPNQRDSGFGENFCLGDHLRDLTNTTTWVAIGNTLVIGPFSTALTIVISTSVVLLVTPHRHARPQHLRALLCHANDDCADTRQLQSTAISMSLLQLSSISTVCCRRRFKS